MGAAVDQSVQAASCGTVNQCECHGGFGVLVGRRQLLGPVLATALVLVQEKFFSFGGNVDKIVLGAVLVVILAFLPEGLAGLARPLARLRQPRGSAAPAPIPTTLEN